MITAVATPPASHGFGLLDWIIVVACGCLLLGIGFYYSRRQRTTEDYFVAGRNQSPLLAGVSLFAALFTLVAFIGVPGEVVQNGPVLVIASRAATNCSSRGWAARSGSPPRSPSSASAWCGWPSLSTPPLPCW
jgi:hypothetical protein